MSNVYGIQWAILGGAKIQIVEAKFFPTNNFNGILSMLPSSPRETCCTINEEHSYFEEFSMKSSSSSSAGSTNPLRISEIVDSRALTPSLPHSLMIEWLKD